VAAADDDFSFVLAAASRLLEEIRQEIDSRRDPQGRGQVLADHVVDALEAIAAKIEEEKDRYPQRKNEASKQAGARALRFYAQLVWGTHRALHWLRSDEHQMLDLGALYFADEIALALLGPGAEVTPVDSADPTCSTHDARADRVRLWAKGKV
jgi:hypothetical protein